MNDITIKSAIIGFFVGGGLLFLLALIGAMGGGDIKLMATMGLLLGYQKILLALLLGFFVGGIISLFLLIFKIKSRKDQIAFGPFLAIGTFLSMTFYSEIIYTYLSLL
jgi:leader peptidase (prepilin peptidase)/N-methyltransferase